MHRHLRASLLCAASAFALLLGGCGGTDAPEPALPDDRPGAMTTDASPSATTPTTPGARTGETGASTTPPSERGGGQPQWNWDGTAWVNHGAPAPDCDAVLPSPVDLELATSVLYPGQVRGDYKAHGGFRFDGLPADAVTVTSPVDGIALRGSRYLASGEIQYTLDIVDPCGRMVRLGHLRTLTPEWESRFEALPAPVELDSRSTQFQQAITVARGEVIATAVGVIGTSNTFVDIGMYDLRQRNASAADPAWLAEHNNDTHAYGLCWFRLLSPEAQARIDSLPAADGQMGRTSDYCD